MTITIFKNLFNWKQERTTLGAIWFYVFYTFLLSLLLIIISFVMHAMVSVGFYSNKQQEVYFSYITSVFSVLLAGKLFYSIIIGKKMYQPGSIVFYLALAGITGFLACNTILLAMLIPAYLTTSPYGKS